MEELEKHISKSKDRKWLKKFQSEEDSYDSPSSNSSSIASMLLSLNDFSCEYEELSSLPSSSKCIECAVIVDGTKPTAYSGVLS